MSSPALYACSDLTHDHAMDSCDILQYAKRATSLLANIGRLAYQAKVLALGGIRGYVHRNLCSVEALGDFRMTKAEDEIDARSGSSRLDSWKEIAGYLKRSVRTVRRWERLESLPVHRHFHGKQGTVYALRSEIDEWFQRRTAEARQKQPQPSGAGLQDTKPALLAVLPLRNLDDGPAEQSFAAGLTEELIQEVGQACPKRLRVIAATSVMQYRETRKSSEQIGQELKADYVLEGSVRRSGGRVRLSARLIAARDQARIWAGSYEIQLPPIFSLQQTLARQVADSLIAAMHETPERKPHQAARPSMAAHTAYIEGRSHFMLTEGESKKLVERLMLAIDQDPKFAASYAELALVYLRRLFLDFPPIVLLKRIEEFSRKALKLDSRLARAHAMLAAHFLLGSRNWPKAEAAIREALRLNPSEVWAWIIRIAYRVVVGEFLEAIEDITLASQLTPRCEEHGMWFALLAYLARNYDFAINRFQEILQLDPSLSIAHAYLGLCYAQKGEYAMALSHCEKARESDCDSTTWGTASACSVYALAGERDSAKRLFQELLVMKEQKYVRYVFLAQAAASLGMDEQALDWLEKAAYEQREPALVFIKNVPIFDPLSRLPRFRKLLRHIGLRTSPHSASPVQELRAASAGS